MHLSSLDNMRTCLKQHVLPDPHFGALDTVRVLEVGSSSFSTGSYRSAFSSLRCDYTGVDIRPGDGVDLVLDDPHTLPFADGSFDIVLSGQTLEHAEAFWRVAAEMGRVLAPGGVCIVIVPSAGPEHPYPVDCYRFLPDAMPAIASTAGLALVDSWRSEHGPWHDLVGVFRHVGFDSALASMTPDLFVEPVSELQNAYPLDLPDEIEHGEGVELKYPFLERLHDHLDPRFYFEIGVFDGASLAIASCEALGVDPAPEVTEVLGPNHRISLCTSDDFFRLTGEADTMPPIDLAYIDGMHLSEFVLKDFLNVERHCTPFSAVLIDDIYPAHPLQAERVRQSRFWTGDVWKIIPVLRGARPDLILLPIDTSPTGTLLIIGLDPTSTALWDRFDVFVDWFLHSMDIADHPDIVGRDAKIDPRDPLIPRVLRMLRAARLAEEATPGAGHEVLERIRHLIAGAMPRKLSIG